METKLTEKEHYKQTSNAEEKAMNWFADKKGIKYTNEPAQFSSYDGFLMSGNTNYIVEVKVRNKYSYEQIESFGGSFLEFKKLNGILKEKNDKSLFEQIIYFNFYKEKLLLYSISSNPNDYEWELKWLRRDNFSDKYEWKFVTKLKKEAIIEMYNYK